MTTYTKNLCIALALLITLGFQLSTVHAQGTAFTYQGQLSNGTSPANGLYDFKFDTWSDGSGGSVLGGPVTNTLVTVSNGLFTTVIDLGAGVFTGSSNWLHIQVRTNGSGTFTSLSPRQQLTPTPYSLFAEGANAANLAGTVPATVLNGVNGSGLTGLNASQLSTGIVPGALLPGDVAYTDVNQTFTGTNNFNTGLNGGRLTVKGSGGIDTNLFTGLGFQYYSSSGEGAILSSYNDGLGYLSFYTKQGGGYPIEKQVIIDKYGGLAIDQQSANSGFIDNGTTNGVGLTFGLSSGEGIASERQPGGNQFGLDFYTDFLNRMAIRQNGYIGIGTTNPGALLEVNGAVKIDGNPLLLSPGVGGSFASDGLVFGDPGLPGINNNDGPFLAGYLGGALGGLDPNVVALSWDASGNAWVNNNLSAGSLTVRGEWLVIDGLTPVDAYIGDDGSGNDVQIGSQKSGVKNIGFYNTADNAYMHIYCSSITIEGGSDLAEPFKITASAGVVPQGAVVVIDEQNPGHLKLSDSPYDTRVAGVVSGANGVHPGIQMQQQGLLEGGQNVALTGRVYVQADASNGAIRPGDMLTTSAMPGCAMKVTDHARAMGAILGKAMTALDKGQGMVLVLVTLQ